MDLNDVAFNFILSEIAHVRLQRWLAPAKCFDASSAAAKRRAETLWGVVFARGRCKAPQTTAPLAGLSGPSDTETWAALPKSKWVREKKTCPQICRYQPRYSFYHSSLEALSPSMKAFTTLACNFPALYLLWVGGSRSCKVWTSGLSRLQIESWFIHPTKNGKLPSEFWLQSAKHRHVRKPDAFFMVFQLQKWSCFVINVCKLLTCKLKHRKLMSVALWAYCIYCISFIFYLYTFIMHRPTKSDQECFEVSL